MPLIGRELWGYGLHISRKVSQALRCSATYPCTDQYARRFVMPGGSLGHVRSIVKQGAVQAIRRSSKEEEDGNSSRDAAYWQTRSTASSRMCLVPWLCSATTIFQNNVRRQRPTRCNAPIQNRRLPLWPSLSQRMPPRESMCSLHS